MIWNDTNSAVLRYLAVAEEPMTAIEIAEQLYGDTGIALHDDQVRDALNALHRNENIHDLRTGAPVRLAEPVGKRGRAKTWAITDLGRVQLEQTT